MKLHNPYPHAVSFDEEAITLALTAGETQSVRWDDLYEVGILTTDQGPFVDDVFWMLLGHYGSCTVPSETRGMSKLLRRLQALPSFDNRAVIAAMGCTDNDRFVVWRRSWVPEMKP